MFRALIAGVAMIPLGVFLIINALGDNPTFPTGYYIGPIVIVLGVILAAISVRSLSEEE